MVTFNCLVESNKTIYFAPQRHFLFPEIWYKMAADHPTIGPDAGWELKLPFY